jgi:hypothetical protein
MTGEVNEMSAGSRGYQVIDFHRPTATCCVCGKDDHSRWGVPIDCETALICAPTDDSCGAKPACEECWQRYCAGQLVGHDPAF